MAHTITARSAKFNTAAEAPNPINPIAGQSILLWIREQLRDSPYRATSPATEDWGWYVDVTGAGSSYLVGASAEPGEAGAEIDWTIQAEKHRSVVERLRSANRMAADDPLSLLLERILRAEAAITVCEVDRDA